jgi:hypothetical protein
MIDADLYWAASGLSTRKSLSAPLRSKTKPTSRIIGKQLDGGCLLFRLHATSPQRNIGTSDDKRASAKAPISLATLAEHPSESPLDCQ